jgi:hypothetical protein
VARRDTGSTADAAIETPTTKPPCVAGTKKCPINNDVQDAVGDPYGRCAVARAIFDPNRWIPADRKVKDGSAFGGTYLFGVDLDPASVVFTIDGVDVRAGASAAVVVSSKGRSGANFKWELKYDKLPDKKTLGDGVHTAALYANALDGTCQQSLWTFVVGKAPKATTAGACQEDVFRGGSTPAAGSVVQAGDVVSATYYDETPLFTYDGADPGALEHNLIFNIDPASNPGAVADPRFNVPIQTVATDGVAPPPGTAYRYDFLGSKGGEYKYGSKIWYTLPASLAEGEHTVYLRAYDSDQNKAGGDCGITQWKVNFVGEPSTTVATTTTSPPTTVPPTTVPPYHT